MEEKYIPKYFHIQFFKQNGKFVDFYNLSNPLNLGHVQDDFLKYVAPGEFQNELMLNLNYVSFLYLDPRDNINNCNMVDYDPDNLNFKFIGNFLEEPKIPTSYIKTNYPEVYNMLRIGETPIIGFCLAHHDSKCKDGVFCVYLLGSRFKTSLFIEFALMLLLITRLNNTVFDYVPRYIETQKELVFWYHFLLFNYKDSKEYCEAYFTKEFETTSTEKFKDYVLKCSDLAIKNNIKFNLTSFSPFILSEDEFYIKNHEKPNEEIANEFIKLC